MIAGPETSIMINEYETKYSRQAKDNNSHHEQNPSTQKRFESNVKDLMAVIEDNCNPFAEDSTEL